MWPFAIVCSRGDNIDFASFCMAVENSPLHLYISCYRPETKTIAFHIKQRFFCAILEACSFNALLTTSPYIHFVFQSEGKMASF